MNDPIQQFRAALSGRNIIPPTDLLTDGKIHRCDAEGKGGKGDAAYKLHMDNLPAGGFENHRDGLGWENWRADIGRTMTPAEEAASRAKIETARHEREAEEAKRKQEAREKACLLWAEAFPNASHAYLTRKGIAAHGVNVLSANKVKAVAPELSPELTGALLVIPMRDTAEVIHSLQFITAEGVKRPLTGGRKRGCYFSMGKPDSVMCLAEGFATGASIHEATGHAVAVAFDAGNLLLVAKALREKFPDLLLVLCADDDSASPGNPGLTKAHEAAQAVGGRVAVPDFGDHRPEGATDFNDLHQAQGLGVVARCINGAIQAPQGFDAGQGEVTHAALPETNPISGDSVTCDYGGGRFEVSPRGVFFTGTDKDGNEQPPRWLCSPLHVVAMTRDAKSSEWGRLLEWQDADRVKHQWAMPSELLQGDGLDVRRELTRLGLTISPAKVARDLLASFLQVWPVRARARCVERLGWHGGVYVTPNESIGQVNEEIAVFQNAHAIEPAFAVSGTAEQWREAVGKLATGNSRLVFALSVAFAGALAEVVSEDSGGFHLRGTSSSGKSTALKVAASVWGDPNTYPRLWRATANGLEGLAALHNDGLLILDELSQIDPREAGEAAYLLANGQGKARASRTGAARQSARWRLLFLSAGEESLTALMARVGKKANAGQEIRLADIDADAGAGMGAFEVLHDQPTPAALAVALKDVANQYHGAVGVEWLRRIVIDRPQLPDLIANGIRQFVEEAAPKEAAGQVLRVARRFALVAVAGELASHYELTGWPEGEADKAVQKCFVVWLESFGGTGNREERAMLSQVRAFFEAHGASRFEDMTATTDQRIPNRAGFYRTDANGEREFIVLSESFRREVCQGLDEKATKAALIKAGLLLPGKDGKPSQNVRLPGLGSPKVYVIRYVGGEE